MDKKKEIIACTDHGLYSVHTLEIKMDIHDGNESRIRRLLERHCEKNNQRSGLYNKNFNKKRGISYRDFGFANRYTCYDNVELFHKGISDIRLVEWVSLSDGVPFVIQRSMRFQLNPRILLGHDDKYIRILPNEEADMVVPALVEAFTPYGIDWYDFMDAKINRMDLCANIRLDTQDLAEKYLKILQKSGTVHGLGNKIKEYDKVSHHSRYPSNTVCLRNTAKKTDSYRQEFVIYPKYTQMIEYPTFYDEEETCRAKGQLRFELHMRRRKFEYIENKYGCTTLNDSMELSGYMGKVILGRYLGKIFGTGKIMSYSRTIKQIDSLKWQQRVREKMKMVVQQTKSSDMDVALGSLFGENCNAKRNYIGYFNKAGISPITVPDSWDISEFENPITYIETRNVNERDLE